MKIGIIGGGAAGFFAAITAKEKHPDAQVIIFEKSNQLLAKVKVSGGGRCNVTNACESISELCKAYPRGGKSLKKAFHVFNNLDTLDWFESRGVPLLAEPDNRVFPASHDSQTIIDCFLKESKRLGIKIETGHGIRAICQAGEQLELHFQQPDQAKAAFDKIIVASGGCPQKSGLEWLESLGHKIENPVPSLFSFNMPREPITQLMGVAVENTIVNIQGTKLKSTGALLITHWGMSGPAILKLSAFGARVLQESDYAFTLQVNWVNDQNNENVLEELKNTVYENPGKLLSNFKPYPLPSRLWIHLLEKCGFADNKTWSELGKKGLNKLMTILSNDEYTVKGKTTFKEEFVTCGGVSLESVDINTMQSRVCKNLYFAGEVLDIDAITGGYNLQAAWTTGFVAGQLK